MLLASIPSPAQDVWQLGPIQIRAYAVCIVVGIVVALWLGRRRWVARGGSAGDVTDVTLWAVPFGVVGARAYHVASEPQLYFSEGKDPWRALEFWSGGSAIWGALAGGVLGAWIVCKVKRIRLPVMADALAPAVLVGIAIGRWGHWFTQELYGGPTDLPWAVEIDFSHRLPQYAQYEAFHPTFLYESLGALLLTLVLVLLDRRFKIGYGRLFALFLMGYAVARAGTEYLRIDLVNEILEQRVTVWVSGAVFLGALAYFVISRKKRPGSEDVIVARKLPV